METYLGHRRKASRYLHVADHMIYMTYNVVGDPKLLLSVMDIIFLSLTNAVTSVLEYAYKYKIIPQVPQGFEAKFMLFKDLGAKYGVDEMFLFMLRDVKDTIYEHKTSPVEFRRKDKYVICSDSYEMKTISLDQIKEYIRQTRDFIKLTEKITSNKQLKNAA